MKAAALAPFRVRSFRLQWPADLAVCWGFEMETLILGWYVLVETESVLLFTIFASLQYGGTLTAPMFGVIGDRIGHRNLLCGMRACYTVLATTLLMLIVSDSLLIVHVFIIAALMGIVRSSDQAVRLSLIGETVPSRMMLSAMSIARTTTDTARILGALAGMALVAALGMGPAYLMIAGMYGLGLVLTLQVGRGARGLRAAQARAARAPPRSPWRELCDGFGYVWNTPHLLAAMCLACLVNLTAFPLINNLMPYVAKEVFALDQRGLGYLVAGSAFGALTGSIVMSRSGGAMRAARMMVISSVVWHGLLLAFSQTSNASIGIPLLVLAGFSQTLTMVPMSTMLIRTADPNFRGRVMGIRMFAIYALPIGLLCAGPLIKAFGYQAMAALYCAIGISVTLLIAVRWRSDIWSKTALSNSR